MGRVLVRGLAHWLLLGCFVVVPVVHADETVGLFGVYTFADHGSMHFRTEPLLDFLRQRQMNLQLDVSNTYDELLLRAKRHDYAALQAPMHFALHLQRCCGYRIVAGWQGPISALLLKLERKVAAADSNHPQTLAVASLLSLSSMAVTGGCAPRVAIDGELHTLEQIGTHERALQALLRGKVSGAIVSSTALRALNRDLRARLKVVKSVDGLPGDVILVDTGMAPVPAWQTALEKEFPNSIQATEFQRRWHRPQGIVTAAETQPAAAESYVAQIDSCMRVMASAATPSRH